MNNILPLLLLTNCFKNDCTDNCGCENNCSFGTMGSILPLLMFTGGLGGAGGGGCKI